MKRNTFFISLLAVLSVSVSAYPKEHENESQTSVVSDPQQAEPVFNPAQPVPLDNLFLLPINHFKTIGEQYIYDKFKKKGAELYDRLVKQLNNSASLISTGIKNLEYYGLLQEGSAKKLEESWHGIIEPILESYLKGKYSLYLKQEDERIHLKVQSSIPQDLLNNNMEAREKLRALQERMSKAMNEYNEQSLAEFTQGLKEQSLSTFQETFKQVERIGAETTANMLINKLSGKNSPEQVMNQGKEAIIKEYQQGVQSIILTSIQNLSVQALKKMQKQYSLVTQAIQNALPSALSNVQVTIPETVAAPNIEPSSMADTNNDISNENSEDIIIQQEASEDHNDINIEEVN